jgi:hypothetical protein
MECDMAGCERAASFRLYIPWTADEVLCAGHARVRSRKDGIVADPLESADDELPEGAAESGDR